jgi:hypothetical protein
MAEEIEGDGLDNDKDGMVDEKDKDNKPVDNEYVDPEISTESVRRTKTKD